MSARVRIPVPPRVRRSQAERTAETRARIQAAVVESIDELGLQRTTASEIARRAGVTWGAVQHHYGDKQGILIAVLEDSTNRLLERLATVDVEGLCLDERIDAFVAAAWAHFGSSHYRCTVEILNGLAAAGDAPPDLPRSLAETGPSWAESWRRFFGASRLPARRAVALQRYTAAVLSGMASLRALDGDVPKLRELELDFLKHTLRRELSV